jgi:hypothetical protein
MQQQAFRDVMRSVWEVIVQEILAAQFKSHCLALMNRASQRGQSVIAQATL